MSEYKVYEDKNKISFNWWGISSLCFCLLVGVIIYFVVTIFLDSKKSSDNLV